MAGRAIRKTASIKNSFYKKTMRAWFKALDNCGGDPNKIKKKDIIDAGEFVGHQRFDQNFGTLDGFYRVQALQFGKMLEKAVDRFDHDYESDRPLWFHVALVVVKCEAECRIAVIRNDMSFWNFALAKLWPVAERKVFRATYYNEETKRYLFATFVAFFVLVIKNWSNEKFDLKRAGKVIIRLKLLSDFLSLNMGKLQEALQKSPLN